MDIREIIRALPLETKAQLVAGKDFWHLHGIESAGIPETMVTDGPSGLRKQAGAADHLGINESAKAVCFPAGCALACSFDPRLAFEMGEELGKIAQAEDVSVVLGPAMNIKRSPLCGRNFEYYSEDPLLSTRMATGAVLGTQSQNVGASPKHFLANNQEYYRMTSNSVVDAQTLREIYLASFEEMVKAARPWTIMCSYNRVNGTYACENKPYLTDILRDEWGFDGYVMTDWGALDDPVESVKAGLDLGMPGPSPDNAERIVQAVRDGRLDESVLNAAIERIYRIVTRYVENHRPNMTYDYEAGHETARRIEAESAVFLRNEDGILPLKKGERVLFVGEYVKNPRYQGGGSSHINPWKTSSVWDEVGTYENVAWARGYTDDEKDGNGEVCLRVAVALAKDYDKVVIFAGLPEAYETEGVDRARLDMPEYQNVLISSIAAVQPNTVVVLHNGSAVTMPWIGDVKGVLELYLGGEAAGLAAADLLYDRKNPSGRLAETFPLRIEDTPTYPYYGVEKNDVPYREGRLVGYRWYNTMKRDVLFPFGYGLSYTRFAYTTLKLDKQRMTDGETLKVTVDVTNAGSCAGKEVVQLYVQNAMTHEIRPLRELRAFEKIELQPGETRTIAFTLGKRAFAEWNVAINDWYVPEGEYKIQIGLNARDMILEAPVILRNEKPLPVRFTVNTPLGDIMAHQVGKALLNQTLGDVMHMFDTAKTDDEGESSAMSDETMAAMMESMPLRSMLSFSPGTKFEQLQRLVDEINAAIASQSRSE